MTDRGPEPSSAEAARWLAKAADDLAVADLLLASPVGVNWAACFHAEQAAEKALKALLVWLGIEFPRTHVLERIADLLPADITTTLDREALISLSPWAVAGRYPEDIADPSAVATTALVNAARAIVGQATRSSGGGP